MTTCFVIGPIGQEYAPLGSPERDVWESSLEIYESVIRGACEFLGIEVIRADQISIAGDITDQIFRRLFESDIVIADVTGANANVMYELGLRHSVKAITIQVADAESALPFDIKAVRTIPISRTQYGLIEARKRLTRAIEAGLEGQIDMVAATRVWEALRNSTGTDVSVYLGHQTDAEVEIEEDDSEGYLELVMGLAGSFESVTASIGAIGECLIEMNEETSLATQEMNSVSADPKDRLNLLRRFASVLGERAARFDDLTQAYKVDLVALDDRVSPLLELMAEHESLRNQEGSGAFLDTISNLAKTAREAFEGLGRFAASTKQLGVISKLFREPSKQIVHGLGRMAETVTILENWEAAVNRIRNEG